jgi:chemotaxis protein methyltransferase CheR
MSATSAGQAEPETQGGTAARAVSARDLAQFDRIAAFAREEAGLVLPRDKAPMVLARVGKRLRALGLTSLAEYCAHLDRDDADGERRELLYTLTTNVTSFLREEHHFEALSTRLLPELVARARSGGRVRIWSAGCSSGQEPYGLAMLVLDHMSDAAEHDLRILATDVDRNILRLARAGVYDAHQVEPLPKAWRDRFLAPAPAEAGRPGFRVADAVRRLVTFRELNLLHNWPMKGLFDIVFCRNVVIYFDRHTQAALWPRFAAALQPGGTLFLGHSERIDTGQCPEFRVVGTTMYQRVAPGAAVQARS